MRPFPVMLLALGLLGCGDGPINPDDPGPAGPIDWSQPQLFVRNLMPGEDVPSGTLPDTLRFHGFEASNPPGGTVTWTIADFGPQPATDPFRRDYRFSVANRSARNVQIETCPIGLYCIAHFTNMPVVGVLQGNQLYFEQWPGQRYERRTRR